MCHPVYYQNCFVTTHALGQMTYGYPLLVPMNQQWPLYISGLQAWRGRKRQAHGHHSPSSIQGKWLAIHGQKNNILGSLCLASYLAANWLQKLEMKHCVYYAEVISVLMCVCLCVYGNSVWFIYNKTKLLFCKMSVFVPYT